MLFLSKGLDIIIISALCSTKLALGVGIIVHLPAVFADFERCGRCGNQGSVGEAQDVQQTVCFPNKLRRLPGGQLIAETASYSGNSVVGYGSVSGRNEMPIQRLQLRFEALQLFAVTLLVHRSVTRGHVAA